MDLATWLDSLASTGRLAEPEESGDHAGSRAAAGRPGNHTLSEVEEILGPVAEWARRELGGGPEFLPLVLTKGLSAQMLQCEAHALDDTSTETESWALLRGNLLDVLVAVATSGRLDEVISGSGADPGGSPDHESLREGLIEALGATDKELLADAVVGLDQARMIEVGELASAARGVVVDASWCGRTEVRHRVSVAGAVDLTGRMDLVLGGPGTGVGGVCVEVKSGSPNFMHRGELHFYSLLWTLRTGSEPAALALWYPGSGVSEVPVHGTAVAGARQAEAVIERLVHIRLGDPPSRKAGPQCGWCGLLDGCDVGGAWLDARAEPHPEEYL